jgi:hypothetical protein
MSDGVLAAIIAACATIFTSFLQLRASFARDLTSRAFSSSGKRKSRKPMLFVFLMLGAATVGGFALSQWLMENERAMKDALLQELQARVATLKRTETQLEASRMGTHAEIEAGVLRRLGLEGVAVTATVGPCKPPLVVNTPALAAPTGETTAQVSSPPTASGGPSAISCTEADASAITLCANVPASAAVTEVELFARAAAAEMPWSTARVVPGAEVEQARFSDKPVEVADGSETKQVCQTFASWSTERAREARMLVRYSL